MKLSYLQQLTIRLGTGLEQIPEATRLRHGEYLKRAQQADGGFAGRMGSSDLYYTSFALRGLAILGELCGEVAERAAEFLRSRLESEEKLIDQMSLIFAAALLDAAAGLDVYGPHGDDWKNAFAAKIELLRCDDGGYAKGPGGTAGSTYQTFLSLLCLELIQRPWQDPNRILEFVQSQRSPLGGFREIRVSKRAGTNPSAAAIGVLRLLDALDDSTRRLTAEFLCDMQDEEGGLLANSRIPIPDLLSTFTGLMTLADLEQLESVDLEAARRFVGSVEHPDGGFLAATWDEVRDVEYTFYGLGCLALLA